MADNRSICGSSDRSSARSEMVCIETNRILDSCRDRDCFEDVKVLLTDFGNDILEHTTNIRAKNACIGGTYIGIEPVKFNRGFYAVTIRFYVKITFEACLCGGRSQEFEGVAVLEKKVVLYGSESNVSVFKSTADTSDYCAIPEPCCAGKNVPQAIVEAVVYTIGRQTKNRLLTADFLIGILYAKYSFARASKAGSAPRTLALSVQYAILTYPLSPKSSQGTTKISCALAFSKNAYASSSNALTKR